MFICWPWRTNVLPDCGDVRHVEVSVKPRRLVITRLSKKHLPHHNLMLECPCGKSDTGSCIRPWSDQCGNHVTTVCVPITQKHVKRNSTGYYIHVSQFEFLRYPCAIMYLSLLLLSITTFIQHGLSPFKVGSFVLKVYPSNSCGTKCKVREWEVNNLEKTNRNLFQVCWLE